MSHRSHNLFWPLALITVAVVTLAVILITSTSDLSTVTIFAATTCPIDSQTGEYPPECIPTLTAEAQAAKNLTATANYSGIIQGCPTEGPDFVPPYPPYNDCLQTRTAILGQTEQASWTDTPVPPPPQLQPTSTRTPTATTTNAATPTRTQTTESAQTATPTQTFAPSATRDLPTPTIEDAKIAESAIDCIPGESISIEGETDPNMALIVTFGERPVGGGFSRRDGTYRIQLHIGDERPGLYPVQVEERDTNDIIQELLCRVPASTPTPTPLLVP
jgi:hypothetical protein